MSERSRILYCTRFAHLEESIAMAFYGVERQINIPIVVKGNAMSCSILIFGHRFPVLNALLPNTTLA